MPVLNPLDSHKQNHPVVVSHVADTDISSGTVCDGQHIPPIGHGALYDQQVVFMLASSPFDLVHTYSFLKTLCYCCQLPSWPLSPGYTNCI